MEEDDIVDTVEEFRPEMRPDPLHHQITNRIHIVIVAHLRHEFRAEVRGHDDDGVLEIDGAALAVRQTAIIQHLQQDVKDVRMCFFNLVEQHDLIGPAANRFRQGTALFITDIAGRCADQPGNGVFLHIFRHVETNHRGFVVEQEAGQGLGQLGLADTRRSEEDERTDRPVGILQAGARTAHRFRHRLNGLALPDNGLGKLVFHAQQLVALAFQHLVDRNARPAGNDMGDVIGRDNFLNHRTDTAAVAGFRRSQFLFEAGNDAIGQLASALELAVALGNRQFVAGFVQPLLQVCGVAELLLFRLPAGRQRICLFFRIGQLVLELLEAVGGGLVRLLLQGFAFDLQLNDAAVQFVQFFRLGIHLHAKTRSGFVHQVDCLIRQEPVGDVAVGKRRSCNKGGIRDTNLVVLFVFFLQPAQDRDRVLNGRLIHQHRLETAGKGRILFHMLAIFIERGGADAVQLTAGKGGLQEVGRVHRAIGLAGADQRVHLVDEQDDAAVFGLHLVQHSLQTLFKLTAIFRTGNQRAHIERHQLLVLQAFGHVAIDDAQRKTFGNRRFTDAGFTDQHGIVLGAA
ncbi:hypothetical protein D3C72_852070 [compost metagenome]